MRSQPEANRPSRPGGPSRADDSTPHEPGRSTPRSATRRALTWLLLRFYPSSFRTEWGPELVQTLDEILDTEGTGGTLQTSRIWLRAFWDATTQGTRERVSAVTRRFGPARNHLQNPNSEPTRPTSHNSASTLEALLRDTRHAVRALLKRPGFTLVSTLTLAIGIGANSAIFSIVNGVLLKPLPVAEPDRLVGLWHVAPGLRPGEINQSGASYFVYQENTRVFESVALWDNRTMAVTGLDQPERVRSLLVTESFLPTLDIPMQLGRRFRPEDDQPGAGGTVVLTDEYWRSRLGTDPGVIGTGLTLDGEPYEIIGVLGPELRSLMPGYQLLTPARLDRSQQINGEFSAQAFARLRPDVTLAQAQTDLARVLPRLATDFAGPITPSFLEETQMAPLVRPLKDDVIKDVGTVLWMLLGAVGIILLIAVANVANLYLVRSQGRQTEIAVRTALGAGRQAILRYFLIESGILGLLGGALGLVFAWGGLQALIAVAPDRTPRITDIGLDPMTLGFTLVLSLAAGLVFGLLPLFKYGKPELSSALKEGSRGSGTGREQHRLRDGLVVTQMAMALLLLVGSGLMFRSFSALRSVDPGFSSPETLVTVRVSLPFGEVPETEDARRIQEQIQRQLAQVPGVASVGASSSVAMDGNDNNYPVRPEHISDDAGVPPVHRAKEIGGDYFQTMGIALLAGRVMEPTDLADKRPVVVVNESFATTYWSDPQEALGTRLSTYNDVRAPWHEIIGVVADVRDDGMDKDTRAIAYFPMVGANESGEPFATRTLTHVVRTAGGAAMIPQIRDAVWSVNPNLALSSLQTHQVVVDDSLARTSFTMVVLGVAAGVALLLGTVGIYGVISYVVGQRTREIGVRMALGADRGRVSRMVVRDGMRLAAVGVGIGLVAAVGLTRVMSALLFAVSPLDPVTFVSVTVVLVLVAAVATWVPARRAATVEPGVVLRGE